MTLRGQSKLGDARQLLEEIVQREPQLATPHLLLGQTLFELQDLEHAAAQFETALQCGPPELDAELCHIMLARCLHRIGDLQRAATHIELAKAYNSGLAIVPAIAARIALKQGRYDVARTEVEAALRIDPSNSAALQIQNELKSID